MAKKYYWLKLHKDFFKRHDIKIVESMANGKDYLLFYLKLLTESIDHEGTLRFNESIPYNDSMLSSITNTNVDTVRSAIKIFAEMGMMDIFDDGTLFMNQVEKMMGCETDWAKKKRDYRTPKLNESDIKGIETEKNEDNVLQMSYQCPPNVLSMSDKSKRIEIENRDKREKEEKINKKENLNSQPFPPYNPSQNLHTMIQKMIDHWNKQPNLPNCRYQSITIPKISDIIPKFDAFEEIEISDSIVNLNSLWEAIDPKYRTSSFSNFFVNDIIDSFVSTANPFEKYSKPCTNENMTKEQRDAAYRYFKVHQKECESWNSLKEFMDMETEND